VISNRAGRAGMWLIAFFSIAISVVPASALTSPNGPHPDPQPQREVLLNGLPIVVQSLPGDRVAVVCAVRAGAMFDPADRSGLASLTGGLLGAGAGSYTGDRIRGELEDAGATLSVTTGWDATWIAADAPASKLSVVLDVISLMVTAPRFAPEDVEAHKREAVARAKSAAAEHAAIADLALARALYGKHTYGRSIAGDPESIASITPGDVKAFFQKFYVANGGTLAVAGRATADEVMRLARSRFGRWPKGKIVPATFLAPTPAPSTRVFVVDQPGLAGKAFLRAGLLAPGRGSKLAGATFEVAAELERDLARQLSNAEAVAATFDLRALDSPFSVSMRVPVAELPGAIKAVTDTLTAYQADDLAHPASAGLAAGEGAPRVAYSLAATEFYRAQNLATGFENRSPAASALSDAARALSRPSALTVVVLGDAAEVAEKLKAQAYSVEVLARP
jgi:zinc protease